MLTATVIKIVYLPPLTRLKLFNSCHPTLTHGATRYRRFATNHLGNKADRLTGTVYYVEYQGESQKDVNTKVARIVLHMLLRIPGVVLKEDEIDSPKYRKVGKEYQKKMMELESSSQKNHSIKSLLDLCKEVLQNTFPLFPAEDLFVQDLGKNRWIWAQQFQFFRYI